MWKDHIARNPHLEKKKGEALRFRNAVVGEVYEQETDEIKAEVVRRRDKRDLSAVKNVDSDDAGVDATEQQRRATARDFHKKVFFTNLSGPSDEHNF